LAQGHVERADAAAYWSGERSFDGDAEVASGVNGVLRQPFLELVVGFFAGEDFKPRDAALAAVGLFDSGVENALRGLPDVAANAVALDIGNDGPVGIWNLPPEYWMGLPSVFQRVRERMKGKELVVGRLHMSAKRVVEECARC
jgi:hypothetical protein